MKINLIVGIVLLFFVISLVASAVDFAIKHPEVLKEMTQEQRTARFVVERMRDEFGMKPQSRANEGHGRHVPTQPRSTQMGSIDVDRFEELKQRLERLEMLMRKLPEKIDTTKTAPSKGAPTNSDKQLEQVNRRVELPPLLSQPSKEVTRAERTIVSSFRDTPTRPDTVKEAETKLRLFVMIPFVIALCVVNMYLDGKSKQRQKAEVAAEEEEKQRRIAEAVAERLAADYRVDSRPLGSEKKSSSQDKGAASVANLESVD